MGELLGLGMTHFPPLAWPDAAMDRALQFALADPGIPDDVKVGTGWPPGMREEYDADRLVAAAAHRAALVDGCERIRAAIDEFQPDAVVIWGDDQYEQFREELVPPFCVIAADEMRFTPWRSPLTGEHVPNVWGEAIDVQRELRGDASFGRQLAADLLAADFDIAYSYRPQEGRPFPHAIANTVMFLDYHRTGFPYAVVPVTVNCYGRLAIGRRGGMVRFAEDGESPPLDPPSPTPQRCIGLGAAIARSVMASEMRVALIASSSWSHAFLHDKGWRMYPDHDADRSLYSALVAGDLDVWRDARLADIEASGQQEMLNWFCLVGAIGEAGLHRSWSTYVETSVFNSNKCFAVFE